MGEANIRNLMTPQENQGFRCERTSDWGPASSANISMRINEMGLMGPENPQLPRGFASGDRTLETAENGKIGL